MGQGRSQGPAVCSCASLAEEVGHPAASFPDQSTRYEKRDKDCGRETAGGRRGGEGGPPVQEAEEAASGGRSRPVRCSASSWPCPPCWLARAGPVGEEVVSGTRHSSLRGGHCSLTAAAAAARPLASIYQVIILVFELLTLALVLPDLLVEPADLLLVSKVADFTAFRFAPILFVVPARGGVGRS